MGFLSNRKLRSITAAEAHAALQSGAAIVIDVRELREFRAGHIPGAEHRPLSRLDPTKLAAGRRHIAVCRSGARSAAATRTLRQVGIDVVNLRGGMVRWSRAGLPMEPKNGRVA